MQRFAGTFDPLTQADHDINADRTPFTTWMPTGLHSVPITLPGPLITSAHAGVVGKSYSARLLFVDGRLLMVKIDHPRL